MKFARINVHLLKKFNILSFYKKILLIINAFLLEKNMENEIFVITLQCDGCKKTFEAPIGEEWRFLCVDCYKKYIIPLKNAKPSTSVTRKNWKQLTGFGKQQNSQNNGC